MIFKKLTIQNFRQFYGKQIIKFATDIQNNVTVIHGFNGSGKTTLLNAFIWLFYEESSPDFENPDYLETEAAFAKLKPNEYLTVSVKLVFEDKGENYTAERQLVIGKDNQGERWVKSPSTLTLTYIDQTGEVTTPGNPQDSLEQLLPKPLYPFFFFNGERIEKLASPEAYEKIESGVKVLLDLEVYDRAIKHLDGKVSSDLRQEVAEHAGDEGEKARQERDTIAQKKEDAKQEIEQFQRNLEAYQEEKDKIDAKLSEIPELAKWQTQREDKENELKEKEQQLKDTSNSLAKALSKDGYLAIVPKVFSKAQRMLDEAHQKGELPIPMKRQFVDELLEKGKCICERNLIQGEHPFTCVQEWRDRMGSEQLEGAVSVTKAKLRSMYQRRDDFLMQINQLQEKRDSISQKIRTLGEELSELSAKIGNKEHGEDARKLESRRSDIETEIQEIKVQIALKQKEIENLEENLQKKDYEIRKLDVKDEKGRLAKRRLDAISNVKSAIEQIRQLRHNQLSKDLSQRLSEVWSRIAIKDYHASLDNRYHLRLTKTVDGKEEPVRGTSTGEKQVLSLAFVGSLVDKARSTYDEQPDKKILFKGGRYALVIDAPFGQLELDYKRDLANWIPTLAPQVILLVPESQWKDEVEEKLQPKIGYQWILECSTQKERTKTIKLRGREYPYIVESQDGFDRTKIVEVE